MKNSTPEVNRTVVTSALVGLATLILLYVLTAPPIMKTMTKRTGGFWLPWYYAPIVWGLENNVTHPVFTWYFNDVWGCDVQFL